MIYLASPYSHPDKLIMKTRFLIVEQVTAHLLNTHQFVYSPIVHCHEIAEKFQLPTSFEFWIHYNYDMLRRADTFGLLAIDGWRESKGVTGELFMAQTLGIPCRAYNELGEQVEWPR